MFGCRVEFSKEGDDALENGRGGLAIKLLINDRLEQGLERRVLALQAERVGTGALDEASQDGQQPFCCSGPQSVTPKSSPPHKRKPMRARAPRSAGLLRVNTRQPAVEANRLSLTWTHLIQNRCSPSWFGWKTGQASGHYPVSDRMCAPRG